MDFDSPDPDVEKEFPGLYASESAAGRKKDDDDCKIFSIIFFVDTLSDTHLIRTFQFIKIISILSFKINISS